MIKTLKAATNLPELLFICREHDILPILTESVFLGMALTRVLYTQHSDKNLALFDSDALLEIVSYDKEAELIPYMQQRKFDYGYKVNKDGKGEPICLNKRRNNF